MVLALIHLCLSACAIYLICSSNVLPLLILPTYQFCSSPPYSLHLPALQSLPSVFQICFHSFTICSQKLQSLVLTMSRPSSGTCAYLPCFLAPWLTSLFQTPIFWSYSSHLFNPTSLFPDPAITVSSWPTISFPDLLHYLLHRQGRLSPYFYLGPTVTPRHAPERLQLAECTKLLFFIHLCILMSGVVYDVSFLTTNWIKLIFTVCVCLNPVASGLAVWFLFGSTRCSDCLMPHWRSSGLDPYEWQMHSPCQNQRLLPAIWSCLPDWRS